MPFAIVASRRPLHERQLQSLDAPAEQEIAYLTYRIERRTSKRDSAGCMLVTTLRWMPWSSKGASMLRRDMMGRMASMLSMMRMRGCFLPYLTSSSSHSAKGVVASGRPPGKELWAEHTGACFAMIPALHMKMTFRR